MATVSRGLPAQPHLDIPKREARELLDAWRAAQPEALERIRGRHPRYKTADDAKIASAPIKLADAQLVLASEYGFANWTELKQRILANSPARELLLAIRGSDRAAVRAILTANPKLLHIPLWNGNWGPPMSHATNLGRLELIQDIAALGARDYQHAFDRAVLQGQLECARWLHAQGRVTLTSDLIMGPCETLNPEGLRFVLELGAPLAGAKGLGLSPVAMVLGTYGRNPAGKHACLDLLAQHGCALPDTPMMALHRGRLDQLARHLARDPSLLARRFTYREIYPTELGFPDDQISGMCGTPIGGTTLLHLAIDFDEQELFDWLLAHNADVNARAAIDAEGFGGHTPLFNAVVSCAVTNGRQADAAMSRALLERRADPQLRASVRKFLDWTERPGWHEARNVTPAEWAKGFPEQNWVNREALRLIGG